MDNETADATETSDHWDPPTEVAGFSAMELVSIASRGKEEASKVVNPLWKAEYLRLANAADHLALMLERVTETTDDEGKP